MKRFSKGLVDLLQESKQGDKEVETKQEPVEGNGVEKLDEWSGGRVAPRDPFWLKAKYAGKDVDGNSFKKGEQVFYYPNSRTFLTGKKAEAAAKEFEAARQDEVAYNMESEEDQPENVVEEAVSDSKLTKLVDAMVYSPRVETILSSMGMEEADVETFKANMSPAIKLVLDKMGLGVTGAATAKKDVKTLAR